MCRLVGQIIGLRKAPSPSPLAHIWANTEHFTLSTAPQGMEDFLALGEKAPVWAPSWWSPWALVPKPGATPTYAEAGGLDDHGSLIRAGPRNQSFQRLLEGTPCDDTAVQDVPSVARKEAR